MNSKSVLCPSCGQPAAGSFCSHCGTSLTAGAAPKQWNAQTIVPWVALGVATVALVVAMVSLTDRGDRSAVPEPASLPFTTTIPSIPAPSPPVDLSSMTPRQAADRLFNRIMAASERGDTAEALRFVPMALQAYGGLETLDNDARYHVALIHFTAGDIESTRVHLQKLRQSVPNHLLGLMLEYKIAERSGNQNSAIQAYEAFLAAYDAEIATGRAEYQDHRSGIDNFRKAAQASVAGTK